MLLNLFTTPKQVETFCPSCNSFYMDFVSNVNVTTYANNDKFYHATCYQCLNDRQDYEATVARYRRVYYIQCLRSHLKAKRLKNQVRKAFRASNSIVEKCFYLAVIEELNNF